MPMASASAQPMGTLSQMPVTPSGRANSRIFFVIGPWVRLCCMGIIFSYSYLKTGEIGMECGFADGSYFIKTFRENKPPPESL